MREVCERCGKHDAAPFDDWCDTCILEVEEILAEVEGPNGDQALMRHYYSPDELEEKIEEVEREHGIPSEAVLMMWLSHEREKKRGEGE